MRKRTGAALGIVAAISCLLFLIGNRLGGLIDVLPGNILQKFTAAVDHFIGYKFTFFKTRSALILGGALFLIAWADGEEVRGILENNTKDASRACPPQKST